MVRHHDGMLTGRLMSSAGAVRDTPAGYGRTQEEVFGQIALRLVERPTESAEPTAWADFLWTEELHVRKVKLQVHPRSVVKKRVVIGKERVEIELGYAWSKLAAGGYRVIVPRFDWWFVLEDLEMAPSVIKQAVGAQMLGEETSSLFAFRTVAQETVVPWDPTLPPERPGRGFDFGSEENEVLESVAENLVERSSVGRKRRPIVGELDVESQLGLVTRVPPRSLLLVGPSGVGKSTWVRALARRLARLRAEKGEGPRIWATSADRIVAGMSYLGQWEQRCLDLIDALSGEGDYLYVDRLTSWAAPQTGHASIGEMFVPAMQSGEVSLIAECTPDELERLAASHPSLLGLFHRVTLEPPSTGSMPWVIQEYLAKVAPNLRIDGAGLRRLVEHLEFFSRASGFPGKAFAFVDWLVSTSGVRRKVSPDQDERSGPPAISMGPQQVSEAFARHSGLPKELISDSTMASRETIARRLAQGVVGQELACSTAAGVLTRFKAGLSDPQRPIGSLFFVGPTGVGKTELAKQLTRYMFGDAKKMIRLDMSEYMLPGSAGRMLAVGRGVRSLVERVRQMPLSLILLDEIEKAHPEVFDLLLGMLGEGRMSDVTGNLVDFRMTLVVMTSNLGVRSSATPGFGRSDDGGASTAAVRAHFRPEFFNRIDHVVPFSNLSPGDIAKVVELELDKAASRSGFTRRGLVLRVHPEAKRWLAREGWHPSRGARPLKRVIEERVISPLAVELAARPRLLGRVMHVVVQGTAVPAMPGDDLVVTLPAEG